MALTRDDIIELIYGSRKGRRFTQDSPVLADVWVAFGTKHNEPIELLLTAYLDPEATTSRTGELSKELGWRLKHYRDSDAWTPYAPANSGSDRMRKAPGVAYNQSTVA